jgi:hypothetical protein
VKVVGHAALADCIVDEREHVRRAAHDEHVAYRPAEANCDERDPRCKRIGREHNEDDEQIDRREGNVISVVDMRAECIERYPGDDHDHDRKPDKPRQRAFEQRLHRLTLEYCVQTNSFRTQLAGMPSNACSAQ